MKKKKKNNTIQHKEETLKSKERDHRSTELWGRSRSETGDEETLIFSGDSLGDGQKIMTPYLKIFWPYDQKLRIKTIQMENGFKKEKKKGATGCR